MAQSHGSITSVPEAWLRNGNLEPALDPEDLMGVEAGTPRRHHSALWAGRGEPHKPHTLLCAEIAAVSS